jgi:GDP-D-mannose 3', 5'-epimerase
VNELVRTVAEVAGKAIRVRNVDGPVGVHSRNFSNTRIESLGWTARYPLSGGIALTYPWIARQVEMADTAVLPASR